MTWEDAYIDEELCVRFNYISEKKSLFVYGYSIFALLVSENAYLLPVYLSKSVRLTQQNRSHLKKKINKQNQESFREGSHLN